MAITWAESAPVIENISPNLMQMDDPFTKSNGAFQQLEQLKPSTEAANAQSYSYGMFASGAPTDQVANTAWQ